MWSSRPLKSRVYLRPTNRASSLYDVVFRKRMEAISICPKEPDICRSSSFVRLLIFFFLNSSRTAELFWCKESDINRINPFSHFVNFLFNFVISWPPPVYNPSLPRFVMPNLFFVFYPHTKINETFYDFPFSVPRPVIISFTWIRDFATCSRDFDRYWFLYSCWDSSHQICLYGFDRYWFLYYVGPTVTKRGQQVYLFKGIPFQVARGVIATRSRNFIKYWYLHL